MNGSPLMSPGIPSPLLDGRTPVFVEVGAAPNVSPGFDAPIGSIARHGSNYWRRWGTSATDWSQVLNLDDHDRIETQTLGASAQNIDFSGLNGDADCEYDISVQGDTTNGQVTVQFNGGGTAALYTRQVNVNGGAITPLAASIAATYAAPNGAMFFRLWVGARSGANRLGICAYGATDGANRDCSIGTLVWPNTADNITSIRLAGSAAGLFQAGTVATIRRWRR